MGLAPQDSNEKSPFHKMLNHIIAGALTLVVLIVIFGTFALFHMDRMVEQLELKTYDLRAQIQWGYTNKHPSSDVLILQFDDPTLNVLNDEYGVWPWPRDVHAKMIHYLNQIGAKALLYDIMFVSHRKGSEDADELLAEAFRKYKNVYLSMNFDSELVESQKLGKDLTPRDIELLQPLAISLQSDLGKSQGSNLKLSRDANGQIFYDNNHMSFNHYRSIMPSLLNSGRNIGIINHGADEDGVSRSNPLFFRFQYHKFVKTQNLPLKKVENVWYDAKGNRTDQDGYLIERSRYLPVVVKQDGTYLDSNPKFQQPVDKDGYLMDGFGHFIYRRDQAVSSMYFPYLGLRAVLDMKFPVQTPELLLTADGHLKFEGFDIPLNNNGDFLVNWYNINVDWEGYRKNQRELSAYKELLDSKVHNMEAAVREAPPNSAEQQRMLPELTLKKQELQKAKLMLQMLDEALRGDYTPKPYKMVSAWEVIRTMKKEEAGIPLAPEDVQLKKLLRDKIIFVGATAVAAYDIKNTSIHPTLPGVVLQANLFDNLYQNDGRYIERAHPNLNLAISILICLLAAGFTFKMRSALAGMLTTANIAVLYILAAILLYQYSNLWVNIAMPLVALVITTTMTFMVKYILRDKDYEKTYAMATTDSMTGLYNHRFFQEHMRRSIEQATKFKHKFSLVLIDIDFFKKFNDTYGHQAGDEVLRQVAKKLKKTVRNVDIVARYGGEEMAVILDRANEEEALAVAHKIVKAIAEEAYPIAEGVAKHVTISCGVATYPTHGLTPSQMIEFSDAGLYRAKENGRNQVGSQYEGTPPPEGSDEQHHAA
ncbi:MAG TPA: diguanylate cyclase [Coleofasciculaceae cyanobacterium]